MLIKKYYQKRNIALKYGIPHNTLSRIIKTREKIENLTTSKLQPERKDRSFSKFDVDRALFIWFKQARSINAHIHGPPQGGGGTGSTCSPP